MQTFTALLALSAVVAAVHSAAVNPVKEKVAAASKKCAADNKLTTEQSKILGTKAIPKTDAEKCYLECVYSGLGLVKDGAFNVEGAKKMTSVRFHGHQQELAAANKVVDTCGKEVAKKEGEKCSLGRAVRECFTKNGKEIHFFPSS